MVSRHLDRGECVPVSTDGRVVLLKELHLGRAHCFLPCCLACFLGRFHLYLQLGVGDADAVLRSQPNACGLVFLRAKHRDLAPLGRAKLQRCQGRRLVVRLLNVDATAVVGE